jgi:hypothetical protein
VNKLDRAITTVYNNIPYKYQIPIKVYKTAREALKAEARECDSTYKKMFKFYTNYFKKPPVSNYMNTKYYKSSSREKNEETSALDVAGIGSYPIKLVEENLRSMRLEYIIFMILHEIGHQVLISGYNYDERACDLFAIRWVKKLANKKVIKKYWK